MGVDIIPFDSSVEFAIQAWLHAKREHSGSHRTVGEYARTFSDFRGALQLLGQDVDSDARGVALCLQAWASGSRRHRVVSPSTTNTRCAIVSSFYQYCIRFGLLGITQNPASRVERRQVQHFGKAVPMKFASISRHLEGINRLSIQGMRDYALLSLSLVTGRRLSELANLTWNDIDLNENGVTVTWNRTKGGKTLRDKLPSAVGKALKEYRKAVNSLASSSVVLSTSPTDSSTSTYGSQVWVSFAGNGTAMRPLSLKGLERICQKHLGTSKFHTLRHSFAHEMENAGAKVSEIQARLGHSNLATTGEYLTALRSDENEYAESLADRLGMGMSHLT